MVRAVKIHADILYEPRVGKRCGVGKSSGGRLRTTRRYVAHSTAASWAAVAGKTLLVGAERQRRVEPTVAPRVPHGHDARLAVA